MNQIASLPDRLAIAGNAERIAEDRVFSDLINTLLAEGLLADQACEWLTPALHAECLSCARSSSRDLPIETRWLGWWLVAGERQAIVFPLHAAIVQPYRHVSQGGAFAVSFDTNGAITQWQRLTPIELMQRVVAQCLDDEAQRQPGVANVLHLLETTLWQARQSLAGAVPTRDLLALPPTVMLQALERRAALRDRPFHPVAKAKEGLDEESHERYAAEFARPMTLNWIAMDRDCLMQGSGSSVAGVSREPMDLLLTSDERLAIEAEMLRRGLSRDTHMAMPVHPWQMEHGLPRHLPGILTSSDGVALESVAGRFEATSSLRSLAPINASPYYLKLPMAVFSLGAARYLPAVKLINGECGQTMLEQAKMRDAVLKTRLHLCDERRWWSYMPQGSGLFDDAPRHLGVMTREYPSELLTDSHVRLIPMASLGVPLSSIDGHFFDDWLRYRQLPAKAEAVEGLFLELCTSFLDIVLRLYRFGLMPEIHGQNVLLVWREGRIDGLLLRDHDSVRLHRPWLDRHDIADPQYRIRPGYSNSLYNERPRDLLFYLQTLGIQVNLYAIIETLTQYYPVEEAVLWQALQHCLKERIAQLPFSTQERQTLRAVLFEEAEWPLKCVLRPLFDQQGVPGSMPSAKSSVANPFHSDMLRKTTTQDVR